MRVLNLGNQLASFRTVTLHIAATSACSHYRYAGSSILTATEVPTWHSSRASQKREYRIAMRTQKCTYVEKVITRHTRLAGNTGRDDDNVGTLERLAQTAIGGEVASDDRGGVDVRKIGSDARRVDAVVRARRREQAENAHGQQSLSVSRRPPEKRSQQQSAIAPWRLAPQATSLTTYTS